MHRRPLARKRIATHESGIVTTYMKLFGSASSLVLASCYVTGGEQFVSDHLIEPKPSENTVKAWLSDYAQSSEELKNAVREGKIRIGMTRRMVKSLVGSACQRLSRDKAIIRIKSLPFVDMWDLWLYYSRDGFSESEDDHLAAIISRRSYVVWW